MSIGDSKIKIPRVWFHDEVRDGYFVDALRKSCWAAQMEALQEVESLCRRHGLRVFADNGTLLGAVRHGGFIPWDDDMDLCMFRDDYMQFQKYASELPEGYWVFDYHEDDVDQMILRVTNTRDIRIDDAWLHRYHNFPYPAGVDIFPLDFISPDPEQEDLRKQIAKLVFDCANAIGQFEMLTQEMIVEVQRIMELTGAKINLDTNQSVKLQLYELGERLFSLYNRGEAREVALMTYWIQNNDHKYDIHLYDEVVRLPFETIDIPAPARYDEVLRIEYGDYMRIVRGGGTHNFPYYSEMEQMVADSLPDKKVPYRYYYSASETADFEERKKRYKEVTSWRGFGAGKEPHREVVFVPYMPETWKALKAVWELEKSILGTDVYVVCGPYFDKDPHGVITETHYDVSGYPEEIAPMEFGTYDFASRRPDTIYIQNPFDSYDYATSVHPDHYARELKKYTEHLVYIPYFAVDEVDENDIPGKKSLEHFVSMPGVVLADATLVSSERMRRIYVDELVRFAGEDTRRIWEDKIRIRDDVMFDLRRATGKNDNCLSEEEEAIINYDIPAAWQEMGVGSSLKDRKKVIFYYTSLSAMLRYEEKMIAKMETVMTVFSENRDHVVVLWCPDRILLKNLPEIRPELWAAYEGIADRFAKDAIGVYDDSCDYERASYLADAYYGDPGLAVEICRHSGKPVMIADCSVL